MSEDTMPAGWITADLGDICEILDSRRIPINATERNERISGKADSELFPYYGATGEVGKIDGYLFDGEYVLIGEDGAPFLEPHRGVSYLVSGKFWVNNHAHILLHPTSNRFLCYYLRQIDYRPFVTGTTRLKLNQARMRKIPLPLPPLAEQKRIVAKIEELFSELDAGEESLRRARRQLGVYRQSLLKQAFEGKLTAPDLETGELPESWRKMPLKEACDNIKVGIVIKPKQYYSDGETGIKAFRSANVREFRIEDSNWVYFSEAGNESNKRTQLKTGDVLIVRSGHPGTSCVVTPEFEGCNAIDILIATPDPEFLRSDYLCTFNNSPLAKGLFSTGARGVAQKHLNVGVYSALTIPVPPLPEQQEIVCLLDEQFEVIVQNEREIDAALKRSEALRQSILKKAFTGQLVPQDPSDEPASTLLERIRNERRDSTPKKPAKKAARKRATRHG